MSSAKLIGVAAAGVAAGAASLYALTQLRSSTKSKPKKSAPTSTTADCHILHEQSLNPHLLKVCSSLLCL
jgi:hypothetical protein